MKGNKLSLAVGGIIILLSTIVFAGSVITDSTVLDSDFYRNFGNFLLENGREKEAVSVYLKGLEVNPNDEKLLNNLGFYYKDQNPLLAIDYFSKAIELNPNYESARNNLAILYNYLEDYASAADQLNYLIKLNPDNIKYNYDYALNMAQTYYHQTNNYYDLKTAEQYFNLVYKKDPNFEHVLDNIKVVSEVIRLLE